MIFLTFLGAKSHSLCVRVKVTVVVMSEIDRVSVETNAESKIAQKYCMYVCTSTTYCT